MPAKDSVTIRMTAEDAGAFEEWRKQAKGPEMMGQAVEKAAKHSESHIKELGKELIAHAGHWLGVAAAIEGAKKVLESYYENKRELEQGEAHAAQSADAALRGYFTTARISDPRQQALATEKIGGVAMSRSATLANAGGAAKLLAQFGVSREDAEGGALSELLQLQSATSAAGGDPEQMARRVLDVIHRAMPGGKVTAQNIRSIGIASRQLTGQEGFNDATIDLFAKTATDLTKGGYDYGTGLALATVVGGKYDPREGRRILRDYAKPGMQKGEAADLAAAKALLGAGGGESAYSQAVGIGESGPMAAVRESETGGILGEVDEKYLDREQIGKRLRAVLKAHGVSHDLFEAGVANYENPWGPDFLYSDEARVDAALHRVYGTYPEGDRKKWLSDMKEKGQARKEILGEASIPLTIRIKGQDGRDVPHSVEAAGVQGQ